MSNERSHQLKSMCERERRKGVRQRVGYSVLDSVQYPEQNLGPYTAAEDYTVYSVYISIQLNHVSCLRYTSPLCMPPQKTEK